MFSSLRIDPQRLWSSILEMATIGATKNGGCNRQAASVLDAQGRDLFISWCKALNCSIHIDQFGNVFARREGRDPSKAAICVGSHLDTQVTGGKFDGIYGVLAGLEIFRTLEENSISTERAIEIAVWTNEEGARFQPAMQGSGVYTGKLDLQTELDKCDIEGIRLGDELKRTGYLGNEIPGTRNISEYFELHIEQGPVLAHQGKQIGVVRLGQGISWYDISITGVASHAGTTPMDYRVDSLQASAQLILEVNKLASAVEEGLTTIGFMEVYPNSINTIPESVHLKIDLRNPNLDNLLLMGEMLEKLCADLASEQNIEIQVERLWHAKPIAFKASDVVDNAVKSLGYSHQDIYSGAGHDACNLSLLMPTGMIFIPSINGISHNEREYSKPEDCEAGCNVLLHVLLQQAC